MSKPKWDFAGWATKANLRCSDGRIIDENAFAHQDGERVPLVWSHQGVQSPKNILGYAILRKKTGGMRAECYFNDSEEAQHAKGAVKHGDITQLSIWAKHLKQHGSEVMHGVINEVSLVLRGANPGAFIDQEYILAHSDDFIPSYEGEFDDDGIIYTGLPLDIEIVHADDDDDDEDEKKKKKSDNDDDNNPDDNDDDDDGDDDDDDGKKKSDPEESKKKKEEEAKHADGEDDETVQQVWDTLSDKQKLAVAAIFGEMLGDDDAKHSMEDEDMKHNVFDEAYGGRSDFELSHADQAAIIKEASENGTLLSKVAHQWVDNFNAALGDEMQHADPDRAPGTPGVDYGIRDIEWLFPEYKNMNTPPDWIKRETEWVPVVMNGVHKTPFSRIKSMFADITADEARAKGYIKGDRKEDEVFTLLRRTTDPQTIYKKQRLDRDDIIDITDFDVVAWLKVEMRMMLDEEIARAILIGDGRLTSDRQHIKEEHIRSIMNDDELYSVKVPIVISANETDESKAKKIIKGMIKNRKKYKGSGSPIFFTTEDYLTDMLLIEDATGRIIYDSVSKLETTLRTSKIQTVEAMEGYKYKDTQQFISDTVKEYKLIGILVNLKDYNVGVDRKGEITNFDGFDIDFNQYKYLMETRMSGALTKPFSALVFVEEVASSGNGGNGGNS